MGGERGARERALHAARLVLLVLVVSSPLVWLKLDRGPTDTRDHLAFNTERLSTVAHALPWIVVAAFALGALSFLLARFGERIASAGERVAFEARKLAATRPRRVALVALPFVLLVLFPLLPPHLSKESRLDVQNYVNVVVFLTIYSTLAVGLNITVGQAGLLVLGYAAFYEIGAYSYAIVSQSERGEHGLLVAIPLAVVASAAMGLLVGLPSLRLRGDYLALVTLGFGETLRYVIRAPQLESLTGGEMGLSISDAAKPPVLELSWYALDRQLSVLLGTSVLFALCVSMTARLQRSRVGRAWLAIREDELAANCMGIASRYYKLLAFVLSAIWAGLAGVAYAGQVGFVSPKSFEFDESILILSMVVLGGMGRIGGAILGAVLLYTLKWILQDKLSEFNDYRNLVLGAIMIVLMVFRPQGLLGSSQLKVELTGEDDGGAPPPQPSPASGGGSPLSSPSPPPSPSPAPIGAAT